VFGVTHLRTITAGRLYKAAYVVEAFGASSLAARSVAQLVMRTHNIKKTVRFI